VHHLIWSIWGGTVPWLVHEGPVTIFLLIVSPLLFAAVAAVTFSRYGNRAQRVMWLLLLAAIVPLGWHTWRLHFSHESPSSPLFDISVYAFPIGMSTMIASQVVRWSAERQHSPLLRVALSVAAAALSIPIALPIGMVLSFIVYGVTGGFI